MIVRAGASKLSPRPSTWPISCMTVWKYCPAVFAAAPVDERIGHAGSGKLSGVQVPPPVYAAIGRGSDQRERFLSMTVIRHVPLALLLSAAGRAGQRPRDLHHRAVLQPVIGAGDDDGTEY